METSQSWIRSRGSEPKRGVFLSERNERIVGDTFLYVIMITDVGPLLHQTKIHLTHIYTVCRRVAAIHLIRFNEHSRWSTANDCYSGTHNRMDHFSIRAKILELNHPTYLSTDNSYSQPASFAVIDFRLYWLRGVLSPERELYFISVFLVSPRKSMNGWMMMRIDELH